ncbi:C25 family peptidase C-terminal domain-containing protein [Paenibacillus bovis]|uniref:SLH domain-containing protein n=1 Tax=Paenibacillus bovis TaxID=1616788 RepID=A0A172ZC16_9BACL|nr:C25 family peptidase C-terminal domain-containing protein [Paenibacillus bovis]ANF95158.1 hypothetical protein AR543_03310 [Paenibacillus bovis]
MRKKGYTLFTMLLVVALVFSSWPGHVQAADGALGISSANGQNVAGQKTNLAITYAPGIQLNLAGSTVFTLPAGITATVADKFNGTNLPANAISSDGRTITLNASLIGLNLLASNTLTLNNKTLPAAGNYSFGASVKNLLNVTIGEATQQGTFTVIGAVPPPTAAQISVSNAISGNSTITVTGQNPGDTITVYNDKNEVLGTGTVNASGQASISAALVAAGGTIQVSALRGTAESAKTSFTYTAAVLSPIPAANISVSNSYGTQDSVAVTGLTAGDLVTVYSNGSAIGTGTADSNGAVTIAVTLTPEGGSLSVTRKRSGVESAATPVSYPAQIIPPVASGNVTVTNSYGGTSQVTVKNLSIGDIVTVSANGTVLATAPAVTNTLTLPVLLEPAGGSLNISVKQGILQSATTTVNYAAIVVPSILSSNIQVKNLSGNADVVTAVNLTEGDTVTVYDGTGVLGTGTVDAQGKVSIPVQLLPVGGSVNVSVNHAGVESLATPVVYVAEIVPAILSNQISMSPILNGTANVSVNGLNNGDTVKVYGNGTVLGTATAGASGTVSIPVSVNAQGGSLSVELLRNGLASAATSITYGAVVVPPVTAANITVSNNSGNNDTVTVTGQTQGNLITVYGNGKVLGTATVGSNGQAVINAALVPVGGVIDVSVTSQGVESVVTPVLYLAEVVPALTAASVNVDNNTGSQDIVKIGGLKQGDTVKVYGSADLLGSADLQADGTLEVPVTLLPVGGSLSVALVRNGVESVPTLVSYSAEIVKPLLPAAIKVENLIEATSKVTVSGLQNGDIIHVYANGELLGTGTADSNGVAAVDTDLAPNGGVVGVSLVRNTVESPTAQISYGSIIVPAIDASQVQPQNNYGDEDTVTITDLKEDQAITVYQDNEVLGTGKANASGTVVIELTLIPAGGEMQVSTEYLGIESSPVSVSYGAEVVPPIPAADITIVNNEGNMDSVSIRNLVAGDLVTIYQSNNVISTKTADTNGNITAGLTLQPYGGTLSFTREHSGIASIATDVVYTAEPGPVLPQSSVSVNNVTGDEDTVQVTGLQQGDMIRVYDANGTLLGSDIAGSFNWVMLQVQLLPEGGSVSVQLTRNQMDSNIVTVTYAAEEVPPANAPVADIALDSEQGDQAVITVTGMNEGDIAKVYDDDDQLLGSASANASGKAAVSFKFLKAQGRLFAKVASGGVETTVRSFDYQGIVFPTTDPVAELTGIDGDQGTVTATNIVSGDTVKVYDADGNLLGTQVADGNGQAVVNFTFPTTDGELTVTVTSNGTETEIITLAYSGVELPVTPTPAANLSDVDGDQGTVTVTNVTSGDTVKVYDADGNLLGTQVADGNGQAVVNFTFPTTDGELTVTVTSNGTETEITTLPYSGVDLPATPAPAANLSDVDGDQGTVTVTNVTSGDTVKVYDADGNLLGTQVADSNGQAVVNFTFPTTDGELTVTVTSNGTETEITTLPYSGVDLPATPAPAANLSDVDGDQGTVTVTNVTSGDTVKVYDADGNLLGTQVADGNGQAVVNFTFPTTDGELTVTVTSNGTETEITTLPYNGVDLPATPAPAADLSDVDGDQGTVTVTNVASGDTVKVYDADGKLLGTQVADSNGQAVVNFTFPTTDGELTVTVTSNGTETEITTLPYSGVDLPATPAPAANLSDVDGDQGTVTVTNVTSGDTVKVYDADGNLLGTQVADGNGQAVVNFTFPTTDGELTVTVTSNGTETEITTLPYNGVDLPATPAPAADLSDVDGDQGTVTVTNVASGDTVKVYDADGKLLGTQVADSNGQAVVNFTFPTTDGELTVTVTSNGTETEITTLPYSGVELPATQVTAELVNVTGDQGTVSANGVQAGDVINVYDENDELLGTATATTSGQLSIPVTFTKSQGTLVIRLERNGSVILVDSINYSDVVIDNPGTPSTPDAVISDVSGDQGTVVVTGVGSGDTVIVYGTDNQVLASEVADGNGTATLTFTFPNEQGELTVVVVTNGTETEIKTLPYSGVDLPATPAPAADLSNVDGDQGTVTVTNVTSGDTVKVYDADGNLLGTQVADSNGQAVVNFTFPTTDGELTVTVTSNGTETEITTLPYSGVDLPATPAPAADLSDVDGDQGTVTVTNVASGDTVKVYDADGNLLGTQVADSNGQAVVNFTFPTTDGELTVTVTSNGTETEITTLPYSGVDVPATPAPAADLSNVDGDQGTVTVTNVASGDTVKVYDADGNLLGTQVADSNGQAVVNFTFPTTDGELTVTVTSNGTETEITTLPYSGVDVPATPAPAADLSNVDGDQGTVTVTNVASGDTVKVYDADGNLLGTQVADGNGQAVVNFTFPTTDGELTVTVTSNGTETEIATLPYNGVEIPGGTDPGTGGGTDPGTGGGTDPGTGGGTDPGTGGGTDPGTGGGTDPGTGGGTDPGTGGGTDPGTGGGTDPGTGGGTDPGTGGGTDPGTGGGTDPGTGGGTDPGTGGGTDPGTGGGTDPGTGGTDPGTGGTDPGTGGTDPGTGGGTDPETDAGNDDGGTTGSIPSETGGTVPGENGGTVPSETGGTVPSTPAAPANPVTAATPTGGTPAATTPAPATAPATTTPAPADNGVTSAAGIGAVTPAAEVGTGGGGGGSAATTPAADANTVTAASGEGTAADLNDTADSSVITLKSVAKTRFVDVNNSWAKANIDRLQDLGILNGVGNNKFDPNAVITRAQFTQMINNLLQLNGTSAGTASYKDVQANDWHHDAISAVSATRITDGYTDGTYQPDKQITREEMAHIISNTLNYLDPAGSFAADSAQTLNAFSDKKQVSNWAKDTLATGVKEKIIMGRPNGKIAPGANATRAEAATVIARLMDRMSSKFNITE